MKTAIQQPFTVQSDLTKIQLNKILMIIFSIIFVVYLIMGVSLGVLPAFIHETLGLSNLWVGVVIGVQYVATLCTRQFSGKMADHRGGKQTAIIGIIACTLSGACLLAAVNITGIVSLQLALLLIGRVLLGVGESYLVVGVFALGFPAVGSSNIGKVMVWVGMGMYAGMACGAPAAVFLNEHAGLSLLFAITIVLPLVTRSIIQSLPSLPLPKLVNKLPFYKAVRLVLGPGSALAFASIGFGGIASFITLYFIQNSWPNASLALTVFACCNIFVRLLFAGAPDKFGGERVAMISLLVEIIGQLLIWLGISAWMTILGAALTGAGMSLLFPSFGKIAVNKVAHENRGTAIAAYNAFFDLGLGLTGPLAGIIAGKSHYENIYLFGAFAALLSAILAYREYHQGKKV